MCSDSGVRGDWQLTDHGGGAVFGLVIEYFRQIMTVGRLQRLKPPVIENQHCGSTKMSEQFACAHKTDTQSSEREAQTQSCAQSQQGLERVREHVTSRVIVRKISIKIPQIESAG